MHQTPQPNHSNAQTTTIRAPPNPVLQPRADRRLMLRAGTAVNGDIFPTNATPLDENHVPDVTFGQSHYFEHEGGEDTWVAGNISNHVDFWKNTLHCLPFVVNTLETGYYLPFLHDPPYHAKNNTSSRRNPTFVSTAIQELLRHKCIERVPPETPHCVNPLTVAEGAKL